MNRQYSASDEPPALGWMRCTVQASDSGIRRVSLGWVGEVWIFLNGQLVTGGKNFYEPEAERRDPDGRLSLENGSFDVPLRKGKNEIAVAYYASVHDDMRPRTRFGWGIIMRFENSRRIFFSR